MGYEVDFLPVKSGGAAISVRWGTPGAYKVLIYDGGTALTGEQMVAHVKTLYMTSHIDYVVSSHPSPDHLAGLAVVLRKLHVGELWMHRPWLYDDRLQTRLRAARALEHLANRKQIPVREPFAGKRIGPFMVLSPDREWYVDTLLPSFGAPATKRPDWLLSSIRRARRWADRFTGEGLHIAPATSAENESSTVLYGEFGRRGVLLTGNAGVQALDAAASFAEDFDIDLCSRLCLIQAPNAGDLQHVSARVLDRIVGETAPRTSRKYTKSAFISVGTEARHRRLNRILMEALNRRGTASFATLGMGLHHWYEMPDRGWFRAKPALPGG